MAVASAPEIIQCTQPQEVVEFKLLITRHRGRRRCGIASASACPGKFHLETASMPLVAAILASVLMMAAPAAAEQSCIEEVQQVQSAIHAGDLSEASKDQADSMLDEARQAGENGNESACITELENVRIIFGVGEARSAVPDPDGLDDGQ